MTRADIDRIRRRMAETEPSSDWPLTWADLTNLLIMAEQLCEAGEKLPNLAVAAENEARIHPDHQRSLYCEGTAHGLREAANLIGVRSTVGEPT